MIRLAACLITSLAGASHARSAEIAADVPASFRVWSEHLAKDSHGEPGTVGFTLGLEGPVHLEGKAALEQGADPLSPEHAYAAWSGRVKPFAPPVPGTQVQVEASGRLDQASSDYTQAITGKLAWAPSGLPTIVPDVEVLPEVTLTGAARSAAVSIQAQWDLPALLGPKPQNGLELKAHLGYRAASDAAASLFAGIELKLSPVSPGAL